MEKLRWYIASHKLFLIQNVCAVHYLLRSVRIKELTSNSIRCVFCMLNDCMTKRKLGKKIRTTMESEKIALIKTIARCRRWLHGVSNGTKPSLQQTQSCNCSKNNNFNNWKSNLFSLIRLLWTIMMVAKYTSFDRSTKQCDYYHCSVVHLQSIELHEKQTTNSDARQYNRNRIKREATHTRFCVCLCIFASHDVFFVGRCWKIYIK